jgi:hypothetical protein
MLIADVGAGQDRLADQVRSLIDHQMSLAAEKAALAALGEAGSRILGGDLSFPHRWSLHVGLHQRGVDHGAGLDEQATLLELRIHGSEDRFGQTCFSQVDAKARQGRRIRYRILQAQPAEPPEAQPVGQSFFEIPIRETVPLPSSRNGKADCNAGAVSRPRRCWRSRALSWTSGG